MAMLALALALTHIIVSDAGAETVSTSPANGAETVSYGGDAALIGTDAPRQPAPAGAPSALPMWWLLLEGGALLAVAISSATLLMTLRADTSRSRSR